MKGHVLVTGGAGYIGSILVPELLQAGYKVTVIDNFMYRQNSLAAHCANPNFTVINKDIRVKENILPTLKKADIVIPLAALVGAPLCDRDPIGATSTNRDAAIMLFNNLSPSQWVLMPTTNSAYGKGGENGWCDETSPLHPMSRYAKDKVEVEQALLERQNAISFRLATVFGMSPRMRIDLLVNDFTYRAVKDRFVVLFESHFRRNYVHVRDVSKAFLFGISNFETLKSEIYNIGLSSANLTKRELCEAIKKHIPEFVFLEEQIGKDPDARDYLVSNAKIEKAGFATSFSLDAGIEELIKGFSMITNSRFGNV
jgi:nucleoside-diphosphate-sugar epimerase